MKTSPLANQNRAFSGLWLGLAILLLVVSVSHAQTLVCGDVVQGAIATLGQTNSYTFSANAGDVVRLISVSKTGGVEPDVQILNPSAVYVGGFGYNDGFTILTLTETGNFTVLVSDRGNNNTGNYSLSLFFATVKCSGVPLVCGTVVTNAFTDPAQQHTYSIAGVAGDVVRLTSYPLEAAYADIDIFNAAGVYVGGFGVNDGFSTLTLTSTETYTVLVRDRGNNNTGSYTLGLVYATPKCAPIPLSCGQVITNSITSSSQQHTYSIAAVAGDVVRLTSYPLGAAYADMDIFNTAGVYVGSFLVNDGFSTMKLTNTGTYTLLVRDRHNINTGDYALSLVYATPKCAPIPLSCGQVLTNTFTSSIQQHTYSIAGVAGDVVRLTSYPLEAAYADIDIFNAAGVYVGGFGVNDGFSTLTLTSTETYTVLVRDRGNNNTGSYTLGLVYATPKCAPIPLSCGQVITNAINAPSQQRTYSLYGLAGEVLHITSTPISGNIGPDVDIFNSAGTYVGGFGYNDFNLSSILTVTNTDIFTVLVRDRNNNNSGNYTLELTVSGGCVQLRVDSTIVRTQQVSCLPVRIFAGSPASYVSFTLQLPGGYFSDVSLNTGGRFTNATFTPGPNSQWFVILQTSPANTLAGDENIGSICFTPVSPESAFVHLTVTNLVVTNIDNTVPSVAAKGSRVVVVADKSLLEAKIGAGGQRMFTHYGKANTNYVVRYSTNANAPSPWIPGWTNTMPSSLFYNQTLLGPLSNAPVLFLRANEQ